MSINQEARPHWPRRPGKGDGFAVRSEDHPRPHGGVFEEV